MIGFSWPGRAAGGIEVWNDGIIVSVNGRPSSTLDDYRQILSIYHQLGDWLMAHNPLPDPEESS